MKQNISALIFIASFLFISSCKKNNKEHYQGYIFRFQTDAQGWTSYFADYPVADEAIYELAFEHTSLPAPLDVSRKSIKQSGHNRSDDLISMIYRKFSGLTPTHQYAVSFHVELASNALKNGMGAGGSPDLAFGAGGISFEPARNIDASTGINYYRPNFNSRIQSNGSNDTLKVIGTIGVNQTGNEFKLLTLNNLNNPIMLTTNANGELWLLLGIDSGFEGLTTLYYKTIEVRLK